MASRGHGEAPVKLVGAMPKQRRRHRPVTRLNQQGARVNVKVHAGFQKNPVVPSSKKGDLEASRARQRSCVMLLEKEL